MRISFVTSVDGHISRKVLQLVPNSGNCTYCLINTTIVNISKDLRVNNL